MTRECGMTRCLDSAKSRTSLDSIILTIADFQRGIDRQVIDIFRAKCSTRILNAESRHNKTSTAPPQGGNRSRLASGSTDETAFDLFWRRIARILSGANWQNAERVPNRVTLKTVPQHPARPSQPEIQSRIQSVFWSKSSSIITSMRRGNR